MKDKVTQNALPESLSWAERYFRWSREKRARSEARTLNTFHYQIC